MASVNSLNGTMTIKNHPDECPYCHKKITPVNIYGFRNSKTNLLDVLQKCPNEQCSQTFIAYYLHIGGSSFDYIGKTTQGSLRGKVFSQTIIEISPAFNIIYNQAFTAEQQGLDEICGVGYRKALEFLIKEYAIKNKPEKKDAIEKKLLGPCIAEYVDDNRIKAVAKRAVWLGNDETHYIKKWEGKNLEDLKKLIELTVHWIEMEVLSKSFEEEMPE
ncbi:protein of unknown function [Flavobacterium flevense]|uniref:DUF4145 domain-containing protein n=1 Tax=Flavobacterium flevense TaxID=983 RepID=A0A4Y4B349_9FLAO|nr:DUF4145 domain-containing protein [Flavobacterium flevense]GEC73832.1 hypothetical protein FFL01_33710 [Flavobacterium flevense]SHL72959.1 protein of unknown function [Flavobacterium flevense]